MAVEENERGRAEHEERGVHSAKNLVGSIQKWAWSCILEKAAASEKRRRKLDARWGVFVAGEDGEGYRYKRNRFFHYKNNLFGCWLSSSERELCSLLQSA